MTHGSTADRGTPLPTSRPRKGRWGRRIGVALLVIVLSLLVTFIVWGRRATRGYAAQLEAYRAAGEPINVAELNAWPALVTPGENAVPALRAAAGSIDEKTDAWQKVYYAPYEWVTPLREDEVAALDALVKENAGALEALEVAMGQPGVDWDIGYTSPMINQLYPDLNPQRSLANLLRAKAQLEHHRGNDAEALRCVERILFVGRAMDHQPTLVSHLVAIGINAIGAASAAEVSPDLRVAGPRESSPGAATPDQVRALIRQLLDERALAEGHRRSWIGERVSQIDTINALGNGQLLGPSATVWSRAKLPFVRPYFYENGQVMTAHTTTLLHATASSPDVVSFRQKLPDLTAVKGSPRYLLASILLPSLDRSGEQHYRLLADRRLTATMLACRLFAADHDERLPRTLEELVPDYLPAVPIDPMAGGGKPLGYVNAEKDPVKPRVYSVGPNGIDQGGTEGDVKLPRRQYEAMRDEVRHLKRQPRPEPPPEDGVIYPDDLPRREAPQSQPADELQAPC